MEQILIDNMKTVFTDPRIKYFYCKLAETLFSDLLKTVFKTESVREQLRDKHVDPDEILGILTSAISQQSECSPCCGPPEERPRPAKSLPKSKEFIDSDSDEDAVKQKPKRPPRPRKQKLPENGVESSDLDKLTIVMLKERCKNLGIKPIGNKQTLINKLREHMTQKQEPAHCESDEIEIVKDEQGLYVHTQSGLIFNPTAKVVVAFKDQDDNVLPLTAEHVELCDQYGFEYRVDED